MKLQIRFKVAGSGNTEKKASKTFSKINENSSRDDMVKFAKAYVDLVDGEGLAVYLITSDQLAGGVDNE